jgi:hypothetical protein
MKSIAKILFAPDSFGEMKSRKMTQPPILAKKLEGIAPLIKPTN